MNLHLLSAVLVYQEKVVPLYSPPRSLLSQNSCLSSSSTSSSQGILIFPYPQNMREKQCDLRERGRTVTPLAARSEIKVGSVDWNALFLNGLQKEKPILGDNALLCSQWRHMCT